MTAATVLCLSHSLHMGSARFRNRLQICRFISLCDKGRHALHRAVQGSVDVCQLCTVPQRGKGCRHSSTRYNVCSSLLQ